MAPRRRWLAAILLVTTTVIGAGCTLPFSSPSVVTASAVFSNVGDLAGGASVEMADIPVGHVTAITLDGTQARVTMVVNRSAHVPADVSAHLQRTTVLGERYIALVPNSPGPSGPLLGNGTVIAHAVVVPGIQQFLSSGASVIGAVNATDLADLIATGAQGFGGQSQNLRQLLDGFATVLHGYAGRTATIRSLINSADQLTSSLAPSSAQNAQAITTLSQTTGMLATQSTRLENLLQSLNDLSIQGRSILESFIPEINTNLSGLASTAQALQASESSLAQFIHYLPGHNATLKSVVANNDLQTLNDFITCGLPGGGANPAIPSQTCGGAG